MTHTESPHSRKQGRSWKENAGHLHFGTNATPILHTAEVGGFGAQKDSPCSHLLVVYQGKALARISSLYQDYTKLEKTQNGANMMPSEKGHNQGQMNNPSQRRRGTVVVEPRSAWTLLKEEENSRRRQSLESSSLPCLIDHPSFPLHLGLTSIAGPAGAGKTQLCLALIAKFLLSNSNGQKKAVYVSLGTDTTGRIAKRLQQLLLTTTTTTTQSHHLLEYVFVNWVRNPDDFMDLLEHKLPRLLATHNPSVVVLDGMAALFRTSSSSSLSSQQTNWFHDRSATFFQIASRCKALSLRYRVPFLVTNEATSTPIHPTATTTMTTKLEPALGLSWAQCVNTSLFVQHHGGRVRKLTTIKSPHVAASHNNVGGEFTIERHGIERIPPIHDHHHNNNYSSFKMNKPSNNN
eukprot:scaffold880_cov132-Cylindrotheca_fusiformis.AAC.81